MTRTPESGACWFAWPMRFSSRQRCLLLSLLRTKQTIVKPRLVQQGQRHDVTHWLLMPEVRSVLVQGEMIPNIIAGLRSRPGCNLVRHKVEVVALAGQPIDL